MRKRIITTLVVIFIFFCLTNVYAQPSIGIKISPARIEHIVNPGDIIEKSLVVTNLSDEKKTLYLYIRDFIAEGESGTPKLILPGSEEGAFLSSWVKTDATEYQFEPKQERTINFRIEVPKEAGPGGYYGAVVFANLPPKADINSPDKGAMVSVEQQVASLLLFTVRGDIDERMRIKDFSVEKSFYNTPFDIKFSTRTENLGNVHIKPQGLIEVKNMFGEKKGLILVNEAGSNVLPKSIRKFDGQWSGKMGFGKYTASLVFSYGLPVESGGVGKKSTQAESVSFWILPLKLVVYILVGAVLLFALLLIGLKVVKRRAVRKLMEDMGINENLDRELFSQLPEQDNRRAAMAIFAGFGAGFIMLMAIIAYFLFFA